jgi:hypothetical protein
MRSAQEDLRLPDLVVVHAGERSGDLAPRIRSVAFSRLPDEIEPLR